MFGPSTLVLSYLPHVLPLIPHDPLSAVEKKKKKLQRDSPRTGKGNNPWPLLVWEPSTLNFSLQVVLWPLNC